MIQRIASTLFILSCVTHLAIAEESKLYWNNGDSLSGRILDAADSLLRWKSPLFTEPFSLSVDQLNMIRLPQTEQALKSNEPIRIVLRTGDLLYGKLLKIDDEHLVLSSRRHGEIRLKRSSVRSLRRLDNPSLYYVGPNTVSDWKTINEGKKITDWKLDSDGHLTTTKRDAEIFQKLQLPDMSEIEIMLHWRNKPDFLIALAAPNSDSIDSFGMPFRLDTWDDEIVAETPDDFEPVASVTENLHQLSLRFYWNRNDGKLVMFSEQGKKIISMDVMPRKELSTAGIYIRNKGSDLTVSHVRVSKWNGKPPRSIQDGLKRVHLVNGEIVYGRVESFTSDDSSIQLSRSTANSKYLLDQIDSLYLAEDTEDIQPTGPLRIGYNDGTLVRGSLVSIQNDVMTVQTAYSDDPLPCHLAGARSIRFTNPNVTEASDNLALIEFTESKLHGTLSAGNAPETAIGWKPVGSQNASPLTVETEAKISLEKGEYKTSNLSQQLSEVVYLRNRDIVPCRVDSIDEKFVYISTEYGEVNRIDQKRIKAVELATEGLIQSSGFEDKDWILQPNLGKTIIREKDRVVFNSSGSIGHTELLTGNEIRFNVEWTEQANLLLKVRLFTDDIVSEKSASFELETRLIDELVWITGVDPLQAGAISTRNKSRSFDAHKRKANFRIVVNYQKLHVFLDGRLAYTHRLRNSRKRGISFRLFGPPAIFHKLVAKGPNKSMLTLSGLEIRRLSEGYVDRTVDPKKKASVLLLPRMYRKRAPTHVLVAKNGDLLRGRILGLGANRVHFTSRMEDFAFPRNALSCMIWLHQDEIEDALQAEDSKVEGVRVVFSGGARLSIMPDRLEDGVIHGVSSVLGRCSIPLEMVKELHLGDFVKLSSTAAYADWKLKNAPEPKFAALPGQGNEDLPFGLNSPLVGTKAVDFELDLQDGKQFKLSDHLGKVVVLDFWASWCAPCLKSLPNVKEAAERFGDEVTLVAVNQKERQEEIEAFLEKRPWKLNVAMDMTGHVSDQFHANLIPYTVIIDKEGTIRHAYIGAHLGTNDRLVAALKALVEDKAESPLEISRDE